jgi:hypothetical protein
MLFYFLKVTGLKYLLLLFENTTADYSVFSHKCVLALLYLRLILLSCFSKE